MNADQLYEAIRHLPPAERLRLVERVVHDVAEGAVARVGAASLVGMMADEPDVMDEVCDVAMKARAKARMRQADG
jgi:dihydroneopterin aldolase